MSGTAECICKQWFANMWLTSIYLLIFLTWVKTLPPSTPQGARHVFGEQKQLRDWDVSDLSSRTSGQEQPEVTRGCRRELWGASTAAGHLREQRHAEAAAVHSPARRTVRHPHRGLRPGPTGGWVWQLNLFLLSPWFIDDLYFMLLS